MVVVVDYGMGNLGSILKALNNLNVEVKISKSKLDIETADKLILPGVGHFGKAMAKLKKLDYLEPLNNKVLLNNTPVLGICLGMQLFGSASEEGQSQGLGWIEATIEKINIKDTLRRKVPHTGWNSIRIMKNSDFLCDICENEVFYFVHSYHMSCTEKEDILAKTSYGTEFVSMVQKGNIYGTQFHPEKSHDQGSKLLFNFITKA